MRIAYSFGVIDLLHFGHINALLKASGDSDMHFFGLVSDESAEAWLGNIVSNFKERESVLNELKCIDEIMRQETFDPTENLRIIHKKYPNAKITMYHGSDLKVANAKKYLESIGGNICITGYYERMSPSNILNILSSKNYDYTNRILMSTKASTLEILKSILKLSKIEDIFIVNVGEYLSGHEKILNNVISFYDGDKIVIRSSSSNEDSFSKSNAGHYDSFLNVDSNDSTAIESAINMVIESYKIDIRDIENEQVLIQRQAKDVLFSGVVFTRDIKNNRPYYLINYDDSGSTDSVTSGAKGTSIWIARDIEIDEIDDRWKNLIKSIKEIENVYGNLVLDIEFAITKTDIVIFQVRPLAASYKFNKMNQDDDFFCIKNKLIDEYKNIKKQANFGILSDMAFWNPSEIIGSNPKPLDYSLYRTIITKSAWNRGLIPLRYRTVGGDLMYKIANKPYISINKTFLSLTPNGIDDQLVEKLVLFYNKKLLNNKQKHDKVEFEIVFNCYNFNTKKELKELLCNGFASEEVSIIETSLKEQTEYIINNYADILKEDTHSINSMMNDLSFIMNSNNDIINKISSLLKLIETSGTPQFSRQARCAFIAKSLCNSMVTSNAFTKEDMDLYMNTIHTIAKDYNEDFNKCANNEITKKEFMKKYGHLRAGTYDIRTERYDKMDFVFTNPSNNDIKQSKNLNKEVVRKLLIDNHLNVDIDKFLFFIKESIEQRELFKFEFTKVLSSCIELIIQYGCTMDIKRNDLSYLEVNDFEIARIIDDEYDIKSYFQNIIEMRKTLFKQNNSFVLPDVLSSANDFNFVEISESRPNFITAKTVKGQTINLDLNKTRNINGKIVLLSKADPGFDWIFSQNIIGLITEYGGAASHMAIRCAEFGIPAAIGCGKKIYEYVAGNKHIILDCKKGKITKF